MTTTLTDLLPHFGEMTPADAAASFIAELQQALDDAAI